MNLNHFQPVKNMTSSKCPDQNNVLPCVRSHLKEFLQKQGETYSDIEAWTKKHSPLQFEPFYSSIDLRDAGYKLAPVDANLYPAGFNNVCPDDVENSATLIELVLQTHLKQKPKSILIIPEAHTKNRFYIDNLVALKNLFARTGIEVFIGWLPTADYVENSKIELVTSDEITVTATTISRKNNSIFIGDKKPDFILLNNDLSSGFHEILKDIEQPIEPSPKLGWHSRKKSDFFIHYNKLARELSAASNIDPWHLTVDTELVSDVDFDEGIGLEKIASAVDSMINRIQKEYDKHNITDKPFVFVKSNAGTYGMGVLKVESGAEILSMNRREKNKMAVGKNSLSIREVIVQEGIPTRHHREGVFAEPVIYLLGHQLLGGFLRKNPTRNKTESLNAKGMVFEKLCMSDLRSDTDRDCELELVYGTIAQLSVAAMSWEIKNTLSTN